MYFISITFGCATSTLYWQNAGESAKLKIRKNNPLMLFNSAFFCKLAVLKKHSLRLVFLELSVLRKPALRQYFFRYLQAENQYSAKKQSMIWEDLKVYKPLKKEELKTAKIEIENIVSENLSKFGFKKYGRKLIRKSGDLFHIIHLDSRGSWMGASYALKTEIAIVSIYDVDVFIKNHELTARKNIEELNPKIRNYYQITQEFKLFAEYISKLLIEIALPYFDKYKSTFEILKNSTDFKIDKLSEITQRNQNLILYSEISNHRNHKSSEILSERINFYERLKTEKEIINQIQIFKNHIDKKEWEKVDKILNDNKQLIFKKLKIN